MLRFLATQLRNNHPKTTQHMTQQARNNHATSSEKDAQQAHQKQGEDVAQVDEAFEARRQRAIDLLEQQPDTQRAVVADSEADPDHVILTVAIRNIATFELMVSRDKFDPFLLLSLIDTHGSQATH